MKIKYSIIVPVYNTEKYIAECLESVLSIERNDLEIIVINDGSTDNSEKIIKEYAKNDNRIVLISKENGGVSSARNCGVKRASGEWLIFLDSDDYFKCSPFEKFDEVIENIADIEYICSVDEKISGTDSFTEYLIDSENKQKLLFATLCIMQEKNPFSFVKYLPNPFRKAIKKSLLINSGALFDNDLIMGEDMMFNLHLQKEIKKIAFVECDYYFYRTNPNSATRGCNKKVAECDYAFQMKLIDFCRANKYERLEQEGVNICVLSGILAACNSYFFRAPISKFFKFKSEYRDFLSREIYNNALNDNKALSYFGGLRKIYLLNAKHNIFGLSCIINRILIFLYRIH